MHVTSSQPFGEALLDAMGLSHPGHTFQATQQSVCLACIGMLDREFAEYITLAIRQRMKAYSPHAPLELQSTLSECLLQGALPDMLPLG